MGKRDVFVCNEEWNGTGRRLDIVGVTSHKRKKLNTAVNTGWIVCKNTTWAKKFFDLVWNVEPRRLRKWPWEQRSFVKVLRSLDPNELRNHVHVEAAKIYNSLTYPPVKKQAILHMMGKNINRLRNKKSGEFVGITPAQIMLIRVLGVGFFYNGAYIQKGQCAFSHFFRV